MDINLKIESEIDSEFVTRAEEELYQILLQQRYAFNQNWYQNPAANRIVKILRFIGLFGSSAMVVLCGILYLRNSDFEIQGVAGIFYILIFIVLSIIFYYLPYLEICIKNFTKTSSKKSCRKLARRCVKKARQFVPFTAHYDIKGDLLTYYRNNNGDWKLIWVRRLNGVAVHGDYATAIFKKWSSIQPRIILFHNDFSSFENILTTCNVKFKKGIQ